VWASRLAENIKKGLEPISRWGIISGVVIMILMVLLITTDVTLRYTMNMPLKFSIEMVEVMLIVLFYSGMAYTQLRNRHIRVDVLTNHFPPKAQLVTTLCTDLLAIWIIIILSWRNVVQAQNLYRGGYLTGMIDVPLWPFAVISALFLAIFVLTVVVDFLENLAKLVTTGTKNYLWLLPGVVASALLLTMAFRPDLVPFEMTPLPFAIVSLLFLFFLIFMRLHIGAAMAIVSLCGIAYLQTTGSSLAVLGLVSQSVASRYVWSVFPLFIFMGLLVAAAGFARDIYDTAYHWLGHTAGGLASATVAACGAFAAICGESLPGIATFGTIALPQMKAYGYDDSLSTGCICSGGTLGILIPPSLGFIVYGIITGESVGKLFIAGIIPGIILALSLIMYIYIRCRLNPKLGPPGPRTTFMEKIVSLKGSWSVLVLFLLVIGGIYTGVFTPTEAGAIGAFGALFLGIATRRLKSLKVIRDTAISALVMSCMFFFIFIYAHGLIRFIGLTNVPFILAEFIAGLQVPSIVIIIGIMAMYLALGCVLNTLPVMVLTLPIIFPAVVALGFDPIWFGVLMTMQIEVGLLTPPIGMGVFTMAGIATDVPMYKIFKGVAPFWAVIVGVIFLIIAFPKLATFLPNLMMGG